jgi:hypothetical protein
MDLASTIAIITDLGGRRCQTIMPYPAEAMMEGTDLLLPNGITQGTSEHLHMWEVLRVYI